MLIFNRAEEDFRTMKILLVRYHRAIGFYTARQNVYMLMCGIVMSDYQKRAIRKSHAIHELVGNLLHFFIGNSSLIWW